MKVFFENIKKADSFARANGLNIVNNFMSGGMIDIFIDKKEMSITISSAKKWRGMENAKEVIK